MKLLRMGFRRPLTFLIQACPFAFCGKTQADKNSRKSKLKQIFAKKLKQLVAKLKFSEKFVVWDWLTTLKSLKNNLWTGEIPQKWTKNQATYQFLLETQGSFFSKLKKS